MSSRPAAGTAPRRPVDLTRSLIAQLDRLVRDLDGGDSDSMPHLLEALVRSLSAAVSSFSGLFLTVVQSGNPVTVTAFGPPGDATPATSLRWTPGSHPRADPAELILYAAMPRRLRRPGRRPDLPADPAPWPTDRP